MRSQRIQHRTQNWTQSQYCFTSFLNLRMACILHEICINLDLLGLSFNFQQFLFIIHSDYDLGLPQILPIIEYCPGNIVKSGGVLHSQVGSQYGMAYLCAYLAFAHLEVPVNDHDHFKPERGVFLLIIHHWGCLQCIGPDEIAQTHFAALFREPQHDIGCLLLVVRVLHGLPDQLLIEAELDEVGDEQLAGRLSCGGRRKGLLSLRGLRGLRGLRRWILLHRLQSGLSGLLKVFHQAGGTRGILEKSKSGVQDQLCQTIEQQII